MKTLLALFAMTLASLAADSAHDIVLKDIDGKDLALKTFVGKAVLVVNVASQCGYTPQYTGLQELHEKMAAKGLVVLGVPCNDFGGQEPDGEKAIKVFCTENYKVTFPMTSKLSIKGDGKHPLFTLLTQNGGDVGWNFEKFLIGKDGKLLKRFGSDVEPAAPQLLEAIQEALK
ncbi:MAG: glutathione peroxidase [Prosthecobacter sp.]